MEDSKKIIAESSKYFYSSYQEMIFYQFYARWNDDLGRRETWIEAIDRYMAYMKGKVGDALSDKEYSEIREALLNQEICPSMRLLWSAGDACDATNVTSYNCLTGETPILTKEFGLLSIKEAVQHGSATVLSHDGQWHDAVLNSFGEQEVVDVTLTKGRRKKIISATTDHRWLIDGEFKTTNDLVVSGKHQIGDKIAPVFAPKPADDNEDYRLGVIHGVIYGDGTTTYRNGKKSGHMIRLCNDSNSLLPYFNGYKYSQPKSYGGDNVVYLYDRWAKNNDLKGLPTDKSDSYLLGFIRGWFAADGTIGKNGQASIAVSEKGLEWLKRYSGIVGLPTANFDEYSSETNYGTRKSRLFRLYFCDNAIERDDVLIETKKDRVKAKNNSARYSDWVVSSVSGSRVEAVYCATVPETSTFVMGEGIVTGNCSYVAPTTWKDLSEIMYVSMCGAGCGFAVEQENVSKFPVIKEQTGEKLPDIIVDDSRDGWCEAFLIAATAWAEGKDIEIDYSMVRPAGTRLKTMGGRASGPQPLIDLMNFTRDKMLAAQGRQLTALELHDIICQIGLIVVAGGVRRCLPYYSLVSTNEGLKRIEDITKGDMVMTGGGVFKEVVHTEDTGIKRLININTQLGVFSSSPEHRWAVLDSMDGAVRWVKASELTSDDFLVHVPEVVPGTNNELPKYKYEKPLHSTTSKDIIIPELDEDIAWLIGNLHGDGYVYKKDDTYGEVTFACAPDMPLTAEKVSRTLKLFGVNPSIKKDSKNDKCVKVRVKSNQLANYLYNFKQPKTSINVPDFILRSSVEVRSAYIAGVFDADGSVKGKNNKKVRPIVCSSIYLDWLLQLRTVLSSIGISSKIKLSRSAIDNWDPLYNLVTVSSESIDIFSELIGQNSEKWKNDARNLERKKEQNSFIVPSKLLKNDINSKLFESSYKSDSKVNLSLSKFEKVTNRKLWFKPVKILFTELGQEEQTYDIQVDGDERFIADGMLVHNSALISLSELHDPELRDAKAGAFWENNGQRSMANNSAVYEVKPTSAEFMDEFNSLVKSGTGERGIFNRGGLESQVPARRWAKIKDQVQVGVNPCGEIYLRSKQFCNLTSIVVRPEDTLEDFKRKMRLATILGTYQATLTDFGYLGEDWKKNCEEEQLLGVSITGYFDNPLIRTDEVLDELREYSVEVNKEYAEKFGANQSTAITCVKPHGNSGQLLYVGSGMHPWFGKYYIRRVRISANDPLMKMVQEQGIPVLDEVGYGTSTSTTKVMEFPIKAPEGALTNKDLSALDMLTEWKRLKEHFTEHNPSVTIYAGQDEWLDIAQFVYKNWEVAGGLSFLPRSEHVYQLAPYEEITEEEYNERKANFKDIDFSKLSDFEQEDNTQGAKELACAGPDGCEVK